MLYCKYNVIVESQRNGLLRNRWQMLGCLKCCSEFCVFVSVYCAFASKIVFLRNNV